MSRWAPWCWASLAGLALCGCGPEGPVGPPLPTGKVPPTLVRQLRGRTTDEWLARAASPDPAVRAEAPWALAELVGDPLVLGSLLLRALDDPDPGVRYAAVVALGRVSLDLDPALDERLVGALAAPERGLARAAWASALARGERVVPALAKALGAPQERLAVEAARLLGELRAVALGAAPALAQAVASAPMGVRLGAMRALARLGDKALPALGEALDGAGGEGALALVELVRAQGATAVGLAPRLVGLLRRVTPDEAPAVEEALVALGEGALPALEAATDLPAASRAAERIRATAKR